MPCLPGGPGIPCGRGVRGVPCGPCVRDVPGGPCVRDVPGGRGGRGVRGDPGPESRPYSAFAQQQSSCQLHSVVSILHLFSYIIGQ